MRRALLAMVAFTACETLTAIDRPGGGGGSTAGGGGSATAGGRAGGGATAGGASGGTAGGVAGGAAGGGCPACNPASCAWDACRSDLCRTAALPASCDGGICTLPQPPMGLASLQRIWGAAPNDLWVLEPASRLHHWNGSEWGCLNVLGVTVND